MPWGAVLGLLGAQLALAAARVVLVAGWIGGGAGLIFEAAGSLLVAAGTYAFVYAAHDPWAAVGAAVLASAGQLAVSHTSIAVARALHLGDDDLPLPPEHPLAVLVLTTLVAIPMLGWVDGVRDIYAVALVATALVGGGLGFAAPRAGLEPAHPAILYPLGFALGGCAQLASAPRLGGAAALVMAVGLASLSGALLALAWGVAARRGAMGEDPVTLARRGLVYGGLGCLAAGGIVAAGIWGP